MTGRRERREGRAIVWVDEVSFDGVLVVGIGEVVLMS